MRTTTMKHNADTGELVCLAAGEEVLRLIEHDFERALSISNAIQEAFRKGSILGRLDLAMSVEKHMDEFNRA